MKARRVVTCRGSNILSRQSAHRWPTTFYPPGRFLVLISVRVDQGAIVRLEGLHHVKKIHLIGTRSHDLPACNASTNYATMHRLRGSVNIKPMKLHFMCIMTQFYCPINSQVRDGAQNMKIDNVILCCLIKSTAHYRGEEEVITE
jgi:hypothetical protein